MLASAPPVIDTHKRYAHTYAYTQTHVHTHAYTQHKQENTACNIIEYGQTRNNKIFHEQGYITGSWQQQRR